MLKPKFLTRPLTSILLVFLITPFCALVAAPDFNDSGTLNKILRGALAVEELQEREKNGVILIYAGDSQQPYTGWIKTMYADSQLHSLFHCEDGLLDGTWSQWHDLMPGDLKKRSQTWKLDKAALGQYRSGNKEGLWTEWQSYFNFERRKRKTSEGRYQGGKKQGAWLIFPYAGGEPEEVLYKGGVVNDCRQRKGKKHGIFYEGNEVGDDFRITEEYVYKEGKRLSERYLIFDYGDHGMTYKKSLEARPGDFKRIPAAFHGQWLEPTARHGFISISATSVRGYESDLQPLKIKIMDDGRVIHLIGLGSGEGYSYEDESHLRISPDGKKLNNGHNTYIRANIGGGRGG